MKNREFKIPVKICNIEKQHYELLVSFATSLPREMEKLGIYMKILV